MNNPSILPPLPPSLRDAETIARQAFDLFEIGLKHWNKIDDGRIHDLLTRYAETPLLSPGQFKWLSSYLAQFESAQPIYGDFRAIWVMFRLAGEHLKVPKIRLVSQEGTFVQLSFEQVDRLGRVLPAPQIAIHRDGWQGHGRRRFVGWIRDGLLIPRYPDLLTEDIILLLQAFSLDPAAVAKASASKLGACSFCATRLSDPESKQRGYGPICAEHYHLPWGDRDEKALKEIARVADLAPENLL